jgi:hypothetical protein
MPYNPFNMRFCALYYHVDRFLLLTLSASVIFDYQTQR